MKFRNYLKAVKIYFLLEIFFFLLMAFAFILGSSVFFKMDYFNNASEGALRYLMAFNQIIGRLLYFMKAMFLSLTGFFIAKNFKTIYSILRKKLA